MDISQAYKSLKDLILQERSDITVVPKTIVSDVFLVPNATEWTKSSVMTAFVSGMQSFESILSMIADAAFLDTVAEALEITLEDVNGIITGALDQLASNYNRSRKPAVIATGVVNFYRPNPLSNAEITGGILSAGVEVYTNAGVSYRVSEDVPYNNTYYDSNLNVYVLDAPVTCLTAGTPGNTEAYTITNLKSAVPGFGNVTNKFSITNGLDAETNEHFADRCKTEISGNNWGTPNGIRNVVLQQFPQLSDILVVGPNDAIMHRDNNWGGRPDVYLLEKNLQLHSMTLAYNGEAITYIEDSRPIAPNQAITTSEGSFIFNSDTTSLEAGSARSRDYLIWTVRPAGSYPKNITVTYFYDKNITDVQTFLEQDDYNTGADILARQSTEIKVDIFFELIVFPGYAFATVVDNIRRVLNNYINAFGLGDDLEQSDIINQVYTVDGVDRIVLPMSKFNRAELTGTVDRVLADRNEYIRLNILSVG